MNKSLIKKITNAIAKLESKLTNGIFPTTFVRDDNVIVSAEDGEYFADYYGEMDGSGCPYIDPRLVTLANKFGGYWEWENPGSIALAL